jgi:hypothetical protein
MGPLPRPAPARNRTATERSLTWDEARQRKKRIWGWTDSNLVAAVSVGQGGKSGLCGKDWRRTREGSSVRGRMERTTDEGWMRAPAFEAQRKDLRAVSNLRTLVGPLLE